ncbi:WD40/YVTN/BNR-like repeat-containing protein [Embleya sp. NPDC055664]|uniref:WD40/YVTN/BNR-like repeat-containing protein n=1 Tax=Embleya sp. NPDC059237 TaxID=3346784 RepID=UPI0036AA8018
MHEPGDAAVVVEGGSSGEGSHRPSEEASREFVEDIVVVHEGGGVVHFLLITYAPGDSGNAAGYVFRRPVGSDEPAANILATNDTLRELWCSPQGHVWATSSTGLVWTSAPVAWTDTMPPDLEFDAPEGGVTWRHTALPAQAHNDGRPNPAAVWGTSDDDVHIATFGGVLYHWNGADWSQFHSGIGAPIGAVRGRAANDVYAAGHNGTLLHFDGTAWTRIADPDGPDTTDLLTGIAFDAGGDVYVTGRSRGGRILRGSARRGFTVAARDRVAALGAAFVEGRLFCAAGKGGVVELTAQGPKTLRDDIAAWSIAEGEGRVYVTETPGEAAYSELDLATGQWHRRYY